MPQFYDVTAALLLLTGDHRLAALDVTPPDAIVVRKGSQVVRGIGAGETLFASDAAALVQRKRSVAYLADGELALVLGYDP
jgi:glucosamine 6-phosphate synthetase-like amidotransferase/phosphosugar isomerase protein